jgi:hypothetical protein
MHLEFHEDVRLPTLLGASRSSIDRLGEVPHCLLVQYSPGTALGHPSWSGSDTGLNFKGSPSNRQVSFDWGKYPHESPRGELDATAVWLVSQPGENDAGSWVSTTKTGLSPSLAVNTSIALVNWKPSVADCLQAPVQGDRFGIPMEEYRSGWRPCFRDEAD